MDEVQGSAKRCLKCGETKPATAEHFSRKASSRDGLYPWCKPCKRAYNAVHAASYRATHKEEDNARSNAYYASHREAISASRKIYNASELGSAVRRRYRTSELGLDARKRYRTAHPDRERARHAVSSAIRSGNLVRQPCSSCGLTPKKVNGQQRIEAHHHLGYSEEHWLDIVWLCQRCHGQAEASERRTGRAETKPPEPSRQESRPATEHPRAEDELDQMSLW